MCHCFDTVWHLFCCLNSWYFFPVSIFAAAPWAERHDGRPCGGSCFWWGGVRSIVMLLRWDVVVFHAVSLLAILTHPRSFVLIFFNNHLATLCFCVLSMILTTTTSSSWMIDYLRRSLMCLLMTKLSHRTLLNKWEKIGLPSFVILQTILLGALYCGLCSIQSLHIGLDTLKKEKLGKC